MTAREFRAALVLICCFLFTPAVLAATQITPVRIFVDAGGRGVVTVTNKGTSPVLYQLTPLSWSQLDGQDVMSPTTEFIASPPSFILKPGAERDIRLGVRASSKRAVERAYRLIIEEVPPKVRQSNEQTGLSVAVRHVLPVFIAAAAEDPQPKLSWSARREGSSIILRGVNSGASHIAVQEVGISSGNGGEPKAIGKGYKYILAGGSQTWSVKVTPSLLNESWKQVVVRPVRSKTTLSFPLRVDP